VKEETDMEKQFTPTRYFRLWSINILIAGVALAFFWTVQFGTREFLGLALVMAAIAFIPSLLVLGCIATIVFHLTKKILKIKCINPNVSHLWLLGPTCAFAIWVVLSGMWGLLPQQRLSFVCGGSKLLTAHNIQVVGYSAFLRGQWLAVFQVMLRKQEMQADSNLNLNNLLTRTSLTGTALFQDFPKLTNPQCFKRVFTEKGERERGGIYAAYDSTTSTAIVFREYHD
jgi:hypothetical protein